MSIEKDIKQWKALYNSNKSILINSIAKKNDGFLANASQICRSFRTKGFAEGKVNKMTVGIGM